ncbi:hypothetical protein [Streptomyces sp. NPDC050848]|uniref:hypothetical protein n=1 Tax=Streptomyces sp. NPDC050848 TaxID=3155791 RepID=UPI0033EDADBF
MPEPTVTVTRHEVSVLPETHPDRRYWSAIVARTDGGWMVHASDGTYDQNGNRGTFENPAVHPDLEAALAVARQVAPHVTLNGHPVTDAPAHTSAA